MLLKKKCIFYKNEQQDFVFVKGAKIIFSSRKIYGRLWGKSQNLTVSKESVINYPTYVVEHRFIDKIGDRYADYTFASNEQLSIYYDNVKSISCTKTSDKINGEINSDFVEVLPLFAFDFTPNDKTKDKSKDKKRPPQLTQLDYLGKFDTNLRDDYLRHYTTIYNTIYNYAV